MLIRVIMVLTVIALAGLSVWVNFWSCAPPGELELQLIRNCEIRRAGVLTISTISIVGIITALRCGYPDVRDDAYTND